MYRGYKMAIPPFITGKGPILMVPENVPKLKVSQPPIFRALAVSFKGGQCLPAIQGSLHWLAIIPIQVDTPLKTNMTLEISMFNRKFILKWWMFHCHVRFFLVGR